MRDVVEPATAFPKPTTELEMGDRANLALEAAFEVDIPQMAPRANYKLHLVLSFHASPTELRRRGR